MHVSTGKGPAAVVADRGADPDPDPDPDPEHLQ